MPDTSEQQFGAEVILTLQDGSRLSRRIANQVGRGGDNPLSSEELWEKFFDCARLALPRQDIMPIYERLESLESIDTLTPLIRRLNKPAPPPRPTPKTPVNTAMETSWVP